MLSQRIRGFDGLRAIAFLLVFVSHKWLLPVTDRLGSVAVWVFFVLSGFLITRILANHRSRIEAGRVSYYEALTDFYHSRAFRIFPPYYAVLAVLTVLTAAGLYNLGAASRQWADLLFYSNIYIEQHGWSGELGHLWSLAVEQQYYLVFAPLVLFTPRARLPALCVALVVVSVVAHIYFLARGAPQLVFDINSFINIGLFGIGGLAGLFADRPLPRWLLNDVSIVAVFSLFLTVVALPVPVFSEYGRLAGVLAACLLIQIAQHQSGGAVRALEFAPIRGLGTISYAAYLFHPMIHSAALPALFGISGPVPHRWTMAMDLAITIALATASWVMLEAPLMRLGRRRKTKLPSDSQALQKG